MSFTDEDLERYARHIVLREIGGPGQQRLRRARVLCVGAGGLGSPVLLYLAAAGVGVLGVADDDHVSLSNLQRQVLHRVTDIDRPKTLSAESAIAALNPGVEVVAHPVRLSEENAEALIGAYDMVIDGSDNFATRRLVATTAARLERPLVFGAIGQWEGQVSVFKPWTGGPCYHCLFPEDPAPGLAPSCSEAGVLGALAGVIGTMMAVEAVKEIIRSGRTLEGRLLLYDALGAEMRVIEVGKQPNCPVCGVG